MRLSRKRDFSKLQARAATVVALTVLAVNGCVDGTEQTPDSAHSATPTGVELIKHDKRFQGEPPSVEKREQMCTDLGSALAEHGFGSKVDSFILTNARNCDGNWEYRGLGVYADIYFRPVDKELRDAAALAAEVYGPSRSACRLYLSEEDLDEVTEDVALRNAFAVQTKSGEFCAHYDPGYFGSFAGASFTLSNMFVVIDVNVGDTDWHQAALDDYAIPIRDRIVEELHHKMGSGK